MRRESCVWLCKGREKQSKALAEILHQAIDETLPPLPCKAKEYCRSNVPSMNLTKECPVTLSHGRGGHSNSACYKHLQGGALSDLPLLLRAGSEAVRSKTLKLRW